MGKVGIMLFDQLSLYPSHVFNVNIYILIMNSFHLFLNYSLTKIGAGIDLTTSHDCTAIQ